MEPIANETWKSLERSRLRRRCLLLLASLGEAYVGQLARTLGIPHRRVLALLHGDPPGYKIELAIVTLGLAERKPTSTGRAYRITTKGLRKARSMTAGRARAAERRAQRRHANHGNVREGRPSAGEERVNVSFTWSVAMGAPGDPSPGRDRDDG